MDRRDILRAQKAIKQVSDDLARRPPQPPPARPTTANSRFKRLVILLLLVIAAGVWATLLVVARYLYLTHPPVITLQAAPALPPPTPAPTTAPTTTPQLYTRWTQLTLTDARGVSVAITQVWLLAGGAWQIDVLAANTGATGHIIAKNDFTLDYGPAHRYHPDQGPEPALINLAPGQAVTLTLRFTTPYSQPAPSLRYQSARLPLTMIVPMSP